MRLAIERTETENLFETLANKSPVGLCIIQDGKFCYTNPTFQSNTGYREDELLGRNSLELAVPEDRKLVRENTIKMLKGELTSPYQFRVIHNDGSIHWVMESVTSVQCHGRQATLGYFVDITERKRIEEQYELLADYSADIIYRLRLMDERFIYVSPSVERILGYTTQEKLTLQPKDVLTQESYEKQKSQMLKDIENGVLQRTLQFKAVHRDGHIVPVEVHASFICDETGQPVEIVGVVRDITERKRAEEALQQNEENYRALFDSTVIGTIVIEAETMKVMIANQAAAEMLGFSSAEEVIGVNPLDSIPPEDRESVSELMTKEFFEQYLRRTHELRMITQDGREIWISANGARIMHEGRLAGLASFTDITERKKMEEALKHAAEEWRKTFDSISDAISIHDRDHKILRANKAFADIFNMQPSQIIGGHCYELHKGQKPISGCPHQQSLATGKPAAAEFYESHLGKYLHESTSPIFNEKGEVVGTVHITRDITEQKQQNERLMMADRLASIGELSSGAAHELNNPLTSIIGFSQLLMEKDISDDIREDVKLIYNEAQRAVNVTKNFLTFARKHTPVKEPNQINNIIEDVLELHAHEHKVNHIHVEKHLAPNLPEILVDYFQMQQVFMNIIINAEYFMIEAHNMGTLTITTKKENSNVRISIADDGPGIPPENLRRIFDPFFTTKEAGRGTGLGLSICHGLVTEHGGQIYVRSQLGKGATIFIDIPIKSLTHFKSLL